MTMDSFREEPLTIDLDISGHVIASNIAITLRLSRIGVTNSWRPMHIHVRDEMFGRVSILPGGMVYDRAVDQYRVCRLAQHIWETAITHIDSMDAGAQEYAA